MPKKDENDEEISKQTIMVRIQKKMASGLANKNTIKSFLSDDHFVMLENLYQLLKVENNKKEAKKCINNIIKLIVKLIVLLRNNQLNEEDIKKSDNVTSGIRNAVKIAYTFWDDDNLVDVNYFSNIIKNSGDNFMGIVKRHLKPKSHGRVTFVFDYLSDKDRLTRIFTSKDPEILAASKKVAANLKNLIEKNEI